jgi:hypothetical protein
VGFALIIYKLDGQHLYVVEKKTTAWIS